MQKNCSRLLLKKKPNYQDLQEPFKWCNMMMFPQKPL